MRTTARLRQCGAVLAGALLLGACGSAGASDVGPAGTPATIAVVTSTDVWGGIVRTIGGSRVSVTSLISDPSADPHSYEANGQNELAVSKAALILENGGGYDDFIDRMIGSVHPKATVLNAVDISGYVPKDGELNEHVWYDFPTVAEVVAKVSSALSAAAPTDAAIFAANATALDAQLTALERKVAAIKTTSAGVGVAITEPVPLYLLEAAGLQNRTPPNFSKAIESENDAPAAVIADTLALFTGHQVKALVYNEQTTGPQTDQVLAAAKANGIAVVPLTETLPAGTDYLAWMNANVDAVAAAVR